MANPHKGEVDVDLAGKSYRLVFTANAICEIEEKADRGWLGVVLELQSWSPPADSKGKPLPETDADMRKRVGKIRVSLLRLIFWGMLREHHAEISLKQAGELMQASGDSGGALELINRVFERSMPAPGDETANPPKPGAAKDASGTGLASATPGAA